MEQSTPLTEAQKVALEKLMAAMVPAYVKFLASEGPDVLSARVETLMQYQKALLGQVQIKQQALRQCQTKRIRLAPQSGCQVLLREGRKKSHFLDP